MDIYRKVLGGGGGGGGSGREMGMCWRIGHGVRRLKRGKVVGRRGIITLKKALP